ncbi:ATP-dependent zinc protease [Pseudomonas sp. M30-35]|uniref:retropepsin-like aspartic peptidase RloA3 n=1 Tax=Pseudomonas sp. M30-35 TaxID=1981174 RepID=UPI002114866E|nr:ATP-dependent zinc protease [Pseudomonas sp. M30-35]
MKLPYIKALAVSILALGLAGPVLAAQSAKVFGWVEEGEIEPEGIAVKIKLDTGAKTSSMDAKDLDRFSKDGDEWVRFNVELEDTDTGKLKTMKVERKVVRNIKVRGAGGSERRPVVMMSMCIGDQVYKEQFSLKNRGKMNYPVLIGRSTIEHLGLVDVSKTFTSEPDCKK